MLAPRLFKTPASSVRVHELSLEMFIGDWKEMKDVIQSSIRLPSMNDADGPDLRTEK